MSLASRGLNRRGMQALTANEHFFVKAGEDMPIGTAVWINPADGLAYKADNTNDRICHGFVGTSSIEDSGVAVQDNHDAIIREGDGFDLKHYLIFSVDPFAVADVQKLIYLDNATNMITLTEPTTSTDIKQVIGRVASRSLIILFVDLALTHEIIA